MLSCRKKKRASAIKRIRAKFGRYVEHEILIFVSGRNVYVQIIDIKSGKTVKTLSTRKKGDKKNHRNIKAATELGKKVAIECKDNNINVDNVSFNRAEKIFCGVVKAVADGFYQK